MIGLDFLILTILLILNLVFLIIKDKDIVFVSWILAFFTWLIGGYYILDIGLVLNIETIYVLFIVVVAVFLLIVKGYEKW